MASFLFSRSVMIARFLLLAFALTAGFTQQAAAYDLLLSTSTNRSNATKLDGATTVGNIYVFTSPDTGTSRVRFYLDDPTASGAPRHTETSKPYDFAGTGSNNTAKPFDTRLITDGTHTITAQIDLATGGMETLSASFVIANNGPVTPPQPCGPPCPPVKINLPYTLTFNVDHGKVLAGDNIGTGFTWLEVPSNGAGYVPAKLDADPAAGVLRVTTTPGTAQLDANSQDNALGVGIDIPSQITLISTTLENLPAGSGQSEQAGLWFGIDEDNYLKVVVVSTSGGTEIQYFLEVGGSAVEQFSSGVLNMGNSPVTLTLRVDPNDITVSSTYRIGNGNAVALATSHPPEEFFSFDAAGIDPTIGTRSFSGIMTSQGSASTPLVYNFDQFSVVAEAPPPPPVGNINFVRSSYDLKNPTSMAWGPDGRLYVTEIFGKIHALTYDANQLVANDQLISTLGSRLTLGITVDPNSTPDNVMLWVSHSNASTSNGEANSGTITRLSGTNFTTRLDVITGLPRAVANHATNSLHFGADGKLYIAQAGNTGAGSANTANTEFGTRAEQPLSAAILVADVFNPNFDGSCANTSDIYGPAPCDVVPYATGFRNSYDFVMHTNGSMYATDNGLGVKGSYPPQPTPVCTGYGDTTSWLEGGDNPGAQPDLLLRVEMGKYYGHPNPYRDECVFKDGSYQGVAPLPNWQPPLYDLGDHKSANGIIEYTAAAGCGALQGELLIANYSVSDDITRIKLSSDGLSVLSVSSLAAGFTNPLPVAQGPDGTIYVGENGGGKVTSLRPDVLGCWNQRRAVPAAVLDAAGIGIGGKLYMVGGKTSASQHVSTLYIYNPQLDSWSQGTDLPGAAVENPAVATLNGKLYVFGGSTTAFSGAVANASVYDPATNGWTTLASMPTPRAAAAAQVIGGRIYVVGGMDGNGVSLNTVTVYNPANNTWGAAPSMATPRDNPGTAVLDGKLYAFGGRNRGVTEVLNTVEMFDPMTQAWNSLAPMPTARRTMVVGTLNGRAQLIGGEATPTGGAFQQNEEYDARTNTWRTLAPMSTPRHGAAAATIDGTIYVVGGGPDAGGTYTAVNEAFGF